MDHAEIVPDALCRLVQRHPRLVRHDFPKQHEAKIAVVHAFSDGVLQGDFSDAAHPLLPAVPKAVQIHVLKEPRRVGQKMPQGDGAHGLREIPGKHVGKRHFQVQLSLFKQPCDAGPGARDLGKGSQIENRIRVHGPFLRLPGSAAVSAEMQGFSILPCQEYRAGDPALLAGIHQDLIDLLKPGIHRVYLLITAFRYGRPAACPSLRRR